MTAQTALNNVVLEQALDLLWTHAGNTVDPAQSALAFQVLTIDQATGLLDTMEQVGWITKGTAEADGWYKDWLDAFTGIKTGRVRPHVYVTN